MLEKPVLIAYTSVTGSARDTALEIEQALDKLGVPSEAREIENIGNLDGYRAVIVGSPIRDGEWLPAAVDFVRENAATLTTLPVFFFLVAMMMHDDTPEHAQTALNYLKPVRKILEPVEVGLFPGKFLPEELSAIAESHLRAKGFPEGDYRDWDAVNLWAAHVAQLLKEEQLAGGI
jgi:menaquinone-dependent protoporphyrinogen oxidase